MNDEDIIPIVVDTRETRSGNIESLKRRRCRVSVEQRDVGDYIIGPMVIERKLGEDFIQSIRDKRIWSQAQNLKNAEVPIIAIITENIWKQMYFTRSNYIDKTYFGAVISLLMSFGISVITFESEDDFLRFVKSAWIKINKDKSSSTRPAPLMRKAITMAERQENNLCSADKISVKSSVKLLEHFGSLKKVANASVNDLVSIDGVGKKIAENIYNMFNEKYVSSKKKKEK